MGPSLCAVSLLVSLLVSEARALWTRRIRVKETERIALRACVNEDACTVSEIVTLVTY